MANPLTPATMEKLEQASAAEEKLIAQRQTVRTAKQVSADALSAESRAQDNLIADMEQALLTQKAAIDAVIQDLQIDAEPEEPTTP